MGRYPGSQAPAVVKAAMFDVTFMLKTMEKFWIIY